LPAGTHLGPYQIESLLGAGGMGEVYKARDTRLDRFVAIKILPTQLAADPQLLERFDREAKSISALNDPNICTLYDVGTASISGSHAATRFLVMEYLEGETLAERLRNGALPIAEALRIAAAIASALDNAHRHGIVHRDLKPGNVFLVRGSSSSAPPTAKLLDFGLAKLASMTGGAAGMMTATASEPLTARGTVLGTFQYMAPEQIEGDDADARTDIFSFGSLLYEVVTGHKAFDGKSQASLLGAILKDDPPPLSQLQPLAPPALEFLIRTCLAKDPAARFQTAHDLLLYLKWIAEGGSAAGVAAPVVTLRKRRERAIWIAGAVVLALSTGGIVWWVMRSPVERHVVARFAIPLPEGQTFARTGRHMVAISPDGSKIVYHANLHLYLRPLDRMDAEPIRGTNENPMEPVFSPDGTWLAYFARGGRTLKKIAISGGSPITIAELPAAPNGASWRNGTIVFGINATEASGIYGVPDGGGELRRLVSVDPAVERASQPELFDDGTHVVFTLTSSKTTTPREGAIVAQSVQTGERKLLINEGTGAHVLPTGQLVYLHDGSLFGVPFNSRTLALTGAPVALAENVLATGGGQFAISSDGTLVYPSIPPAPLRALVWVDRQGREDPIPAAPGGYLDPRLSPDGRQLAVSSFADIWIWTFANHAFTRLTFTPGPEYNPAWLPDGRRVIFDANEGGVIRILRKAADGTGTTDVAAALRGYPETVTPDGKFLVYHTAEQLPMSMVVPLDGSAEARPLVRLTIQAQTLNAEISPDGHWIAYQSDESGRSEIYVHPFPAVDAGRWQISFTGGSHPLWARKGRELFFINGAGVLVSAPISGEQTLTYGKPVELFPAAQYYVEVARNYDVSVDGTRFLFVKSLSTANRPSLMVVSHWLDDVQARMGTK
jgi:Tol biopolymer transport system component